MASLVPVSKYIPTNGFTGQYRIRGGSNGSLFIHALAGSALYSAVSGEECGFPDARSSFNMNCRDVNNTASNVGFCQSDIANSIFTYSIPAAKSFRFVCDIKNWTNRSNLATAALAQVGLVGQPHANFATDMTAGPNAASNSAIYVQFAANTMVLYVGTTASTIVQIPTTLTEFSIRIEYVAGKAAFLYLNDRKVTQVNTTTATTKLQVFARAGHTAAYTAATDSPIRFEVDAVSVTYDK